jgi:hypothetical protein
MNSQSTIEALQISSFYEAIEDDVRIGTSHICVYIALLNATNYMTDGEYMEINRNSLMKNAKVSRKTYSKCMRELMEFGYIKYEPSSNPLVGSKVYLNRL